MSSDSSCCKCAPEFSPHHEKRCVAEGYGRKREDEGDNLKAWVIEMRREHQDERAEGHGERRPHKVERLLGTQAPFLACCHDDEVAKCRTRYSEGFEGDARMGRIDDDGARAEDGHLPRLPKPESD